MWPAPARPDWESLPFGGQYTRLDNPPVPCQLPLFVFRHFALRRTINSFHKGLGRMQIPHSVRRKDLAQDAEPLAPSLGPLHAHAST
jgi:hypothetical protein